jgi:hypothetical protein
MCCVLLRQRASALPVRLPHWPVRSSLRRYYFALLDCKQRRSSEELLLGKAVGDEGMDSSRSLWRKPNRLGIFASQGEPAWEDALFSAPQVCSVNSASDGPMMARACLVASLWCHPPPKSQLTELESSQCLGYWRHPCRIRLAYQRETPIRDRMTEVETRASRGWILCEKASAVSQAGWTCPMTSVHWHAYAENPLV